MITTHTGEDEKLEPSYPTGGYSGKKIKTCIYSKTHAEMILAAVFIIAKNRNNTNVQCSSMNKGIYKMWYMRTLG